MIIQSFIQDIIDHPNDLDLYGIFADYLEEQNDKRSEFLRLIPNLLQTPKREGIHSSLAIKVWIGPKARSQGNTTHTSRKCWPYFQPIYPNNVYSYRGMHYLGRLLGNAIIRETQRERQEKASRYQAFCELKNCNILEYKDWVKYKVTIYDYDCAGYRNSLVLSQSGKFTKYINVAYNMVIHWSYGKKIKADFNKDHLGWCKEILEQTAIPYGRFLDLIDNFQKIVPWKTATELYKDKLLKSRQEWERRNNYPVISG